MFSGGNNTARIEAIYRTATYEHSLLRDIPPLQLKQIIAVELHRIDIFEQAAREDDLGNVVISSQMAQSIGAVWTIQGNASTPRAL